MRKRKSLEERLWALIVKAAPNECWLWIGGHLPKGYGTLRKWNGTKWISTYAHREVLIATVGEPTDPSAHALHSCDNPACCNPKHLSWGTNSKNRREARDRLHNQGNQKLIPSQVEEIRSDSRKYQEIADAYLVHLSTVALIKQNRSWQSS